MGIIVRGHIVRISGTITGVMKKKRDEDLKLLGARIRQMRQVRGFSQEQLALEAGLDRSYVGGGWPVTRWMEMERFILGHR